MGPHDCAAELCAVQRPDRGAGGPHDSAAELCAVERPDRGAGGPHDSTAAELCAIKRPDRGAVGFTDSTAKLQADALADGNTRKSHGGSRICADAAAFVAAF